MYRLSVSEHGDWKNGHWKQCRRRWEWKREDIPKMKDIESSQDLMDKLAEYAGVWSLHFVKSGLTKIRPKNMRCMYGRTGMSDVGSAANNTNA